MTAARYTRGMRTPPVRIDVRGLGFTPGLTTLLQGISFSAGPGEVVGLLGPSGAGKSTLMKRVAGYLRHDDGEVRYNGWNLDERFADLRRHIGFVPQDDLVHETLTARRELTYAGLLRMPHLDDDAVDRRVTQILRQLELTEFADRRISRLSGGQRKRVSMGVELMTSPPVLFLDEPTAGLDPALEEKMMKMFRGLAEAGRTLLVTTHLMETLSAMHQVLILVKGRLAYYGPPEEALGYFGVKAIAEIYPKLGTQSPADWARRYASSSLHRKFVEERLSAAPPAEGMPTPAPTNEGEAAPASPAAESGAAPPTHGRQATSADDAAAGTRGAGSGGGAGPGPAEAKAPREAAPPKEEDLDAELEALKREVRG